MVDAAVSKPKQGLSLQQHKAGEPESFKRRNRGQRHSQQQGRSYLELAPAVRLNDVLLVQVL